MTTMTRRASLMLVAAAALAGCQTAATTSSTTGPTSSMSPDDLDFVTNAFNIIEFDRQECTIAQAQAKSPEVRQLAVEFLQEANDFDAKLQPIAASAGIKPPTVLRTDLKIRAARLRLGQGFEFDRSFIDDQIVSHQDALNSQEMMMNSTGNNSQLQDLSHQGTDILRKNLARLHALQGKMMRMKG